MKPDDEPPREVILTLDNIAWWPNFMKLFEDGKIILDKRGRFRYLHGAPVGRLILTRILKDGSGRYKESAEEWFSPESQRARDFVWPV